jgi:hypothetical protein
VVAVVVFGSIVSLVLGRALALTYVFPAAIETVLIISRLHPYQPTTQPYRKQLGITHTMIQDSPINAPLSPLPFRALRHETWSWCSTSDVSLQPIKPTCLQTRCVNRASSKASLPLLPAHASLAPAQLGNFKVLVTLMKLGLVCGVAMSVSRLLMKTRTRPSLICCSWLTSCGSASLGTARRIVEMEIHQMTSHPNICLANNFRDASIPCPKSFANKAMMPILFNQTCMPLIIPFPPSPDLTNLIYPPITPGLNVKSLLPWNRRTGHPLQDQP